MPGGASSGGENAGTQVSSQGVRKSSPLSMQMVTMAVGDLDGDGVEEIVLATDGELQFYHFREGRFAPIAKAPISKRLKIHAINLADLDKNGKMEIYISATDENTVSSLIAEWDKERGLQILHKNIRWYLRPMEVPGEGCGFNRPGERAGGKYSCFPWDIPADDGEGERCTEKRQKTVIAGFGQSV